MAGGESSNGGTSSYAAELLTRMLLKGHEQIEEGTKGRMSAFRVDATRIRFRLTGVPAESGFDAGVRYFDVTVTDVR